jgi:hypothetical protein
VKSVDIDVKSCHDTFESLVNEISLCLNSKWLPKGTTVKGIRPVVFSAQYKAIPTDVHEIAILHEIAPSLFLTPDCNANISIGCRSNKTRKS